MFKKASFTPAHPGASRRAFSRGAAAASDARTTLEVFFNIR
jgi:hypothetical protein